MLYKTCYTLFLQQSSLAVFFFFREQFKYCFYDFRRIDTDDFCHVSPLFYQSMSEDSKPLQRKTNPYGFVDFDLLRFMCNENHTCRASIVFFGSEDLKTELPATAMSTPAFLSNIMLPSLTPPSTSMRYS